jgi:hypothetical protein
LPVTEDRRKLFQRPVSDLENPQPVQLIPSNRIFTQQSQVVPANLVRQLLLNGSPIPGRPFCFELSASEKTGIPTLLSFFPVFALFKTRVVCDISKTKSTILFAHYHRRKDSASRCLFQHGLRAIQDAGFIVPARTLAPTSSVSGLSVLSRSVTQGVPSIQLSS